MKTFRTIFLIMVLLRASPLAANPIPAGFFNELQFTSSGWVLEIHVQLANLDGWYIRSNSGSAFFKDGISLGERHVLITQDSLMSPLGMNEAGDSLTIYSPEGYTMGHLRFGDSPGTMVASPRTGQSICLKYRGGEYYLDNSPTLGEQNDSANALGTIQGCITDALGRPFSGVSVRWLEMGLPVYSDSIGMFAINEYAQHVQLTVTHVNCPAQYFSLQIWPESTVTLDIAMGCVLSAIGEELKHPHFGLNQNYPNPFNPMTSFSFTIPRRSFVSLKIYDIFGREVATVVNEARNAGTYEAQWDASNIASGVYFYRLTANGLLQTRKMVLMR